MSRNAGKKTIKNRKNSAKYQGGRMARQRSKSGKQLFKSHHVDIDLRGLKFLDEPFLSVLQKRMNEAENCFLSEFYMATIVLCGSVLEGILHRCALQHPKTFNSSTSAPKDQAGKVIKLSNWSTESLINVSHAVGLMQKDVKEFSKQLIKYRNYIHPAEHVKHEFKPTKRIAKMCIQMLIMAISDMEESCFNGGGG